MSRLVVALTAWTAASPALAHSGTHLHPHEAATWLLAMLVLALTWLTVGSLTLIHAVARASK